MDISATAKNENTVKRVTVVAFTLQLTLPEILFPLQKISLTTI